MLEKFRNRLLVSLGVLFAPMATIATAEDAANYAQLKDAIDGSAEQINILNNIDFGTDGTTLDIAAATTISGAARTITSNTNAQTPVFNVSEGNSLTLTNLTLRQTVGAAGNSALIESAGNLNLSGVTLQNSAQSIRMTENGAIVFSGTTNNVISSAVVTGTNNSITNNSTGTLTLNGDMSGVRGTYTQTAGTTQFADNSAYFTGTSNLSDSTVTLGNNVNITSDATLNLNGNTIVETNNGNTISASAINVLGEYNNIVGGYTINGTADKISQINIGGDEAGNDSLLAIMAEGVNSNVVIGPNTDINIRSNGTLLLHANEGTISLERSNNSLEIANNGTLSLQGTKDINLNNSIVSVANSNINKSGNGKLTVNADMSGVKGTYTQTAGTTQFADNSAFFAGTSNLSDSTVTLGNNVNIASDATLNLNGNTIIEANNGNTISASAINTAGSNNIRGSYTINGTAAKSSQINVGATGTNSSLTLSAAGANSNVVIGSNTDVNILANGTLNLNAADGNITVERSNNSLEIANNGTLSLQGTKDINLNNSIVSVANSNINKSGNGKLTVSADMSGVKGTYTQTAGTTEFADNSAYFTGTSNLSNSTVTLGKNVDITSDATLNLNGNAIVEANNGNTISTSAIKATKERNAIRGSEYTVNGVAPTETAEAKYTTVTIGNEAGENSSLAFAVTPKEGNKKGNAVVGPYTDIKVLSNGNLIFDTAGGDVTVEKSNNEISLANNSTVTLAGSNTTNLKNSIKTAEGATGNIVVIGNQRSIVDINADMSGANAKYTQNAGTVNVNDKFFAAAEASVIGKDAVVNFNNGAAISTNNLTVNEGILSFNENEVSAITDAKFAQNGGYIKYGENSIALNQANVTLNNGYVLSAANADTETEQIEIASGTKGIKSLTLKKAGVAEGTKINVTDKGSLIFSNDSSAEANSSVTLDDSAVVVFANTGDAAVSIGSDFTGTGTINKNGNGNVIMSGKSSGFTGIYNQTAGKTEFAKDSVYFQGTSNITNSTLALGENVNITPETIINLEENGVIEANNGNKISASAINATKTGNNIKGVNYTINGIAPSEEEDAKYTVINVGNAEGLNSELSLTATSKPEAVLDEEGNAVTDEEGNPVYNIVDGNVVIGAYTDINVNTNGNLKLNAEGGKISVESSDKAISLANNATLTFTGKDTIIVDKAIVTIEEAVGNIVINAEPTVYFNTDMSGATVNYTQSNGIVNVNNKFFNTQEGSSVTDKGVLNLNQGAQLSSNLAVNNNGSVTFNENEVSAITDAKFAQNGGYITYGENNLVLSQANVTLNNGYTISATNADTETAKIEIGQNTQGVKSLTLQNASIENNTDINLTNGKLNLQDGAKISQGSTIAMDKDSFVNFQNNKETLEVASTISGNGTISKVKTDEENQNLGLVQLTGDNSGFTGKYIQNAGVVEFTSGSSFFGDGFTTQITGGELKVADGVNVTNTQSIVVPVVNSALTTEIKGTNADLYAKEVIIGENQAVTFKLENSGLALNKNANVTTSANDLVIGNDGTNSLITNLSLGNSAYNPEETVNINLAGENTITLVNANAENNVGVLTIGDNINFVVNPEEPLALTTNLGDNTAVVMKVSENSPLNNKEIALNLNANQAADIANNAKLVKASSGKLLLGGDNSNFNGTVEVNNGSIGVNENSLLGSNVKYNLQNAESNANISLAPLHDTAINPNIDIIGINLADNATAKVVNTSIDNGTVTVAGATLVDNNSSLTIAASDVITLADTKIGSASEESNGNITLTANNININNTDAVLVKGENTYLTLNGESNVANDFVLKNATLNLNGNMNIGGNFSTGSTVNMINGQINTQTIAGNMNLTGNTDYKIDINGVLLESDKVVVNGNITAAEPSTLDISQINFITEPKYDNTLYQVFNDANTNAGQEIDPNVVFSSSTGFIDGAVGKYVMSSAGNGSYLLSRVGYNPYVLAGPVAVQAGYYTQLNSYNLAFSNADMIMALPRNERTAYKNANKYAAAEAELPTIASAYPNSRYDVNSADKIVIDESNLIQNQAGGWFRPYGIFENVKLKHGPEVGNNMYGAYVGAESKVKELGHGFDGTLGVYAGYDGSHQTFEGVGVYQNGGTIGLTGALYKNDFFNLSTINVGASGAEQEDAFHGSADFWLFRAGLANKTGYNWDLADGKFIIQPHLMMSLSSVSLFSYEAAPNIKIDDESLFTYQLAPGIKFIGNTANGWQPYASIDMIWNIGGHNNNKANGISLPEMYSEPWLEYGLGLQKRYGERFTGYGQAMFRSIGRNGVALTAGMRWRVGEGR